MIGEKRRAHTNNQADKTDWARYERMKREYESRNPWATHEEYQAAMQWIVRKCGV